MEKLWTIVQQNAEVQRYMPSSWDNPKKADRKYVVTVLSTLYPDFMMELGDDVKAQRQELRDMKRTKVEEVNISDEWLLALQQCTFVPCKYTTPVSFFTMLYLSYRGPSPKVWQRASSEEEAQRENGRVEAGYRQFKQEKHRS